MTSFDSFSYTSSNLSVAIIIGNTVTVVGVGRTTITATQAESDNFLPGIIRATLQVNKATSEYPNITDGPSLLYTMNSTSPYIIQIINDIQVSDNLIAKTRKVITIINNNTKITKAFPA